jgi:hypothetical protein
VHKLYLDKASVTLPEAFLTADFKDTGEGSDGIAEISTPIANNVQTDNPENGYSGFLRYRVLKLK